MSKGSKIYEYFTEIADEEKIVCNQCHDWFDKQECQLPPVETGGLRTAKRD